MIYFTHLKIVDCFPSVVRSPTVSSVLAFTSDQWAHTVNANQPAQRVQDCRAEQPCLTCRGKHHASVLVR
jgi:hypothetical protein